MTTPLVLVTHDPPQPIRHAIMETLGTRTEVQFLPELSTPQKTESIGSARALLTYDPLRDLGEDGVSLLKNCGLIQCLTAGIDYLPLSKIPPHILVTYNAGAYAEPMAEHVVAMALAASKRLSIEHRLMMEGEFNQFVATKKIAGGTCGILGFGAAGREVGRLVRALGMDVEAINRSGKTGEPVSFIGTLADTERVLANADVLVITIALTRNTEGLIDARKLALMKSDAVLVNVARGEVVDEEDLYQHLVQNPHFTACLEAWWVEPVRHGKFETQFPFFDLPNIIASPHNSAMTDGALVVGARRGAQNVLRFLQGEAPQFVASDDMKMF